MGHNDASSHKSAAPYGPLDRRKRRKYLTRDERQRFRAALEELKPVRRAFCQVLYHTGCRISEALELDGDSLKMDEGVIVFETLKRRRRGHFRSVPVERHIIESVSAIAPRDPTRKIWKMCRSTAYRQIKTVMDRAGIVGPQASPKGLRHSFGVAHVGTMVTVDRISKWLGHTKPETTAIYLAVVGEEERALAKRLWELERG